MTSVKGTVSHTKDKKAVNFLTFKEFILVSLLLTLVITKIHLLLQTVLTINTCHHVQCYLGLDVCVYPTSYYDWEFKQV